VQAAVLEEDRAEWFEDARLAILRLSITESEFSADDLRKVMRPAPSKYWPGLAFTAAKNAGLIEKVSDTTSKSRSRKGGSLKTWRRRQEGVTVDHKPVIESVREREPHPVHIPVHLRGVVTIPEPKK
jgi:hypothetical protein